jgi:hypothetical protein
MCDRLGSKSWTTSRLRYREGDCYVFSNLRELRRIAPSRTRKSIFECNSLGGLRSLHCEDELARGRPKRTEKGQRMGAPDRGRQPRTGGRNVTVMDEWIEAFWCFGSRAIIKHVAMRRRILGNEYCRRTSANGSRRQRSTMQVARPLRSLHILDDGTM